MSEPSTFEYQAELNAIIAASKANRRWYEKIDLQRLFTVKFLYLAVSVMSFVLMAIFGFVSMNLTGDCLVEAPPPARCCSCQPLNATQLDGQVMPTINSLNSVFYGIVMVVNSMFGIYYVVVGVQNENKYQLLCMLVTQLLECGRGLSDAVFEPVEQWETNRPVREGIILAAMALCIICLLLVPPVYKVFGWAVFRKGGAKHSTRQMYKTFQLFRALNRLDLQSSFMLFLIFIMYLKPVQDTWYLFLIIVFCDMLASTQMVRGLKRETLNGVVLSAVAKLFVTSYWVMVIQDYLACYYRYEASRVDTTAWWSMARAPDLQSVIDSYNGQSCLAPRTIHDARTQELILLNFCQAMTFRLTSMIASVFVGRNFGKGLKGVFYRIEERQQEDALARQASVTAMQTIPGEGGRTVQFKSKVRVSAKSVTSGGMTTGDGSESSPSGRGTTDGDYEPMKSPRADEDDDAELDEDEVVRQESGW